MKVLVFGFIILFVEKKEEEWSRNGKTATERVQISFLAHWYLIVVVFGIFIFPSALACCILYSVCICRITCFQSLMHKIFGAKEAIICSTESFVRMILGFLTSKWLFESLSKPHLGFRSLVFFLICQSHQAVPFKHCFSRRATFQAVLGASCFGLDMQFIPLDNLLKCLGFYSTHSTSFLSSCLSK